MNKAVDDLIAEQGQEIPELKDTQDEMNEMLRRVQADAKDKEAKMQEKLRQVSWGFSHNVSRGMDTYGQC